MKKRAISLLLVVCMVFSVLPLQAMAAATEPTPPQPVTNQFTDVSQGDWFYDAVQYASRNGFFSGTDDKTFSPDGTTTRAMFVTVLGRMAGVNAADYTGDSGFTDVPETAYYAPYVKWAAKYGVTGGTGDKRFSPDSDINRQQMATFFARYFAAFKVVYATGAAVTTVPEDLDTVDSYAREAVLKLWQAGLLGGDGKRFDPDGNATRAQVAKLCMSADKAVETWYKEPGVPSARVSVDGQEPQKPIEKPKPPKPDDGGSGGSGGGTTTTVFHEVKFHAPADMTGVELPKDKVYAENTVLTSLPTPFKKNTAFLGWYYDEKFTTAVQNGDKLTKSIDLYANFIDDVTPLSAMETPNYITTTDVSTNFTFKVQAESEAAVKAALTLNEITAVNAVLPYTVTDNGDGTYTISATLSGGQTYKAELPESSDVLFVHQGVAQPASIRVYNFITTKAETLGLKLNKEMTYIPNEKVSNMTGSAFDGLFTATAGGGKAAAVTENTSTGTFTYGGDKLAVGDTVSIYSGTRPDLRSLKTTSTAADGDVAYVTVTAVNGNEYSYTSADSADVMFTPDVLPISATADKDTTDNQITVTSDVLDFTDDKYAEAGLSSQTVVETGDFIAFYTGEFDVNAPGTGNTLTYGKITRVAAPTGDSTDYVIGYTGATEAEITAAMDIYSTREEEIEVTPEQAKSIEASMEKQAMESGFAEESAEYLAGLALETDGFRELSGDMDLKSYTIETADGKPLTEGEMALMAEGSRVKITKSEVSATVAAGKLVHFGDSRGVRAELALDFVVEITPKKGSDNKIEVSLQAIFEQEVLLSVNVSGGAIWKKAWIFPYIDDYQLNANFDVGTFTGIGVTATAKTVGPGGDDGYDWKPVTGNKFESKLINIGKQITELMDQRDEFLGNKMVDENGEEIEWSGSNGGGLADKYSKMIENADASWIELFRQEIFSMESSVDPFHILVFGISADFVVSANMYITIGMTFEYANAKRYNFSLMLFHKQTSNETIDLEEEHYQFDFYVMGTLGIRAGLELEVGVGLFSLKLDSIGITAELGAYAQLWGYFYYSLTWSASAGKDSSYSGAMLIDIGIYLKITFKAQLFSSDKLTYQPTLLDKQWPLFTVGEQSNVYDFNYDEKKVPDFTIKGVKTFTLPTDLFDMQYMDMKTGEIFGGDDADEEHPPKNFDDGSESHFSIKFSNPAFGYNGATNTVMVTPVGGSIKEDCTLSIVWKNGTLAFTSEPISREIPIAWSDPANARYISFDAGGGTNVQMISDGANVPIKKPADPVKQGYTFTGWFTDEACTKPFVFPDKMPEFTPTEKGLTVRAGWAPAMNSYKVERYYQELNGQYVLTGATETMQGLTEANTVPVTTANEGFTYNAKKSTETQAIAANGSTVVKLYFDRNKYKVKFNYGNFDSAENKPVEYEYSYEADIYEPTVNLGGYLFTGWYSDPYNPLSRVEFTETVHHEGQPDTQRQTQQMGAKDITYYAGWIPDPNTPYRVERYIQRVGGNGYVLDADNGVTIATGPTDSPVPLQIDAPSGLTNSHVTVNGKTVTNPRISPDGKTVAKQYFNRNQYALSFMVGDTLHQTEQVRYGKPLQAPAAPTQDGYLFAGWYYDRELTRPVAFGNNETMPASDLTLYGKMEAGAHEYSVRHHVMNILGLYTSSTTTTGKGKTGDKLTLSDLVNPDLLVPNGICYKEGKTGDNIVTETVIPARSNFIIDLYYERVPHTLTWDFGGSTPDGSYTQAGQVRYGAEINPPMLYKPGYELRWLPNKPTTMPAEDATYSVSWVGSDQTAYTVEHYQQNANDDNYKLKNTEKLFGRTDDVVTATAKTYEHFTENASAPGAVTSGTITPDGQLLLKVYYDRDTFTVTFDGNGGTLVGAATKSVRYGATVTTETPTREGYGFAGWHKNAVGSHPIDTMPAEDITLYATWAVGQVSYTVEHYVMQVDGTYPATATRSSSLTGVNESVQILSLLVKYELDVSGKTPYKETRVNDVVQTTDEVSIAPNMVIKLYYERAQYLLGWEFNGGVVGNEAEYTKAGMVYYDAPIVRPVLTKGTEFLKWTNRPNKTMPAQNVTFTATWEIREYRVRFIPNGDYGRGTDQNFIYGAPPEPLRKSTFERDYYTFMGWGITSEGPVVYADEQLVQNLTDEQNGIYALYAQWAPTEYPITYRNLYGGTNPDNVPTTYRNTESTLLPTPTQDGYTFARWNRATGCSTIIPTNWDGRTLPSGNSGPMVFDAKWTPLKYPITYELNGGRVEGNTGNPVEYSYKTSPTRTVLIAPTRRGYTFTGWSGTGLTGSNNVEVTIPLNVLGGLAYTAHWTPITYTITYDWNSGDGPCPSNPTTYTSEDATFTLQSPTADSPNNGKFLGWHTDNWADFTKGSLVTEIPKGSAENITLHPMFKENAVACATINDLITGMNTTADGVFYLTQDITTNGWPGYTRYNGAFTGILYGNGHTITLNNATAGLFKWLKGTVIDLTVTGSITISEKTAQGPFDLSVGGGIANINAGIISGCTVKDLTITTTIGASLGGIAGQNDKKIENCRVIRTTLDNASNAGGLTAYNRGPVEYNWIGGDVIDVTITNATRNAGGMVGWNIMEDRTKSRPKFYIRDNCNFTVTANIGDTLTTTKASNVGGLAGYNSSGCEVITGGTVLIRGNIFGVGNVGGVLGGVDDFRTPADEGAPTNITLKNITFAGTAGNNGDGATTLGGIMGYSNKAIFNNCIFAQSAKLQGSALYVSGILGQGVGTCNPCHVYNTGITATATNTQPDGGVVRDFCGYGDRWVSKDSTVNGASVKDPL